MHYATGAIKWCALQLLVYCRMSNWALLLQYFCMPCALENISAIISSLSKYCKQQMFCSTKASWFLQIFNKSWNFSLWIIRISWTLSIQMNQTSWYNWMKSSGPRNFCTMDDRDVHDIPYTYRWHGKMIALVCVAKLSTLFDQLNWFQYLEIQHSATKI